MNKKYIISILIIFIFLITGFLAFKDSNIEYSNFQNATSSHKTCQVKGSWVKDKESGFDASSSQFSFFMKDENNNVMKIVLDGAKPNNFEMAESVVAKGKVVDGVFHAKEVLTKCPSKYEGKGDDIKKSGM